VSIESLSGYERRIAVHHWNGCRPHPHKALLCPYDGGHRPLSSATAEGEVVLYCHDCQAVAGFVPDHVYEYYLGCRALGWVAPMPPPDNIVAAFPSG
jgi:hypothetical protein